MVKIDVTPELIKQVAKNSALELTEEEIMQFTADFEDVLKNFEKLEKAVVAKKPSFHPIPTELFSQNYREDVPGEVLTKDEAL
jgi:aspartyl/glutamyl-tRNA(Asn/Gln) amidotransferase C subunit